MPKSVSVVIPNYNGKELLIDNLPSVYAALQKSNIEFEIIVSDDASKDDSVAVLKDKFANVTVITSDKNQGFSPTINKGIAAASKDLVLLLNTDVSLTIDYFQHLFQYFEKADTFGVSGRFIGLNDNIIQDAGKYPLILKSKKVQPYNFYVENPSAWIPTLFVSGGCALVDRQKLNYLEGFNTIYAPFYYEDTDLSVRAWEIGWRCYYEHQAICRHPASTTINKFNKKRSIWITTQRNKLIFHSLHLSGSSKLSWNLRQTITLIVQALAFRWRYHEAFLQYFFKRAEIKESKKRQLAICGNRYLPIEKVMQNLRVEIGNQKITRL